MLNNSIKTTIFSTLICISPGMMAADLMDVWQSAQSRDPEYISSRFNELASEKKLDQSRALWLPNVFVSATVGSMSSNSSTVGAQFISGSGSGPATFNTSINNGMLSRYVITATQPIYDLEKLAQTRQLKLAALAGNLSGQQSQQKLILLVADRYFSVLTSQENLRLAQKLENSIQKTHAEVLRRLRVGDATQTDAQETLERLNEIKAKIINAQVDLKSKELALQDLLGKSDFLKKIRPNLKSNNSDLKNINAYIEHMKSNNLQLKLMAVMKDIAKQEADKYLAQSSIRLNAIAQASKDNLNGSGDFGSASNNSTNTLLGIQLNVPLFTGGYRSAKLAESLQLIEKSQADLDQISLQIEQNIRSIWFTLNASKERFNILENTLKISQARLASTIKQHELGARTTLEVLAAQIDAVNAEQMLYTEKVQYILNHLNLNALTGNLSEQDLKLANNYLE